ncbi:EamA-like transporter family [Candidatus Methylobacter favarea]|uniref:EamA-like transporter family n=1 Tax=Candidatus Methylobacter favarea TaxID=2707345 RepID=A0A8S0WYS9_9GAMM|nr:EamA family transporter [Candidatus Methylobacter favarea]CAA9889743.1 EamA-like transporter family [Candidatus Methylobacter favarea]
MWLFYALLGPPFCAIVHVLDSHCVENVFDRPFMGVITGSVASLVILLAVSFAMPFAIWQLPGPDVVVLALLAGGLIQLSQAFYFKALQYSEAGIVAAYWNLIPILLPLTSYYLFDEVLTLWQYAGIGILIFTSVCFCLLDSCLKGRWYSFMLMLAACMVQVITMLIQKTVFEQGEFFICFLIVMIGIIGSGVLPLLIPDIRKALGNNMPTLRPAIPMLIGIEAVNWVALYTALRAVDLGEPALVAAVETTIPGYTFALTLLLVATTKRFDNKEARQQLPLKLALVALMTVGVWQVS